MSVTIRVRPNGPLLIEGAITILDQHGNPFPTNPDKPAVALAMQRRGLPSTLLVRMPAPATICLASVAQ